MRVIKRVPLLPLLLASLLTALPAGAAEDAAPPNILLVISDDVGRTPRHLAAVASVAPVETSDPWPHRGGRNQPSAPDRVVELVETSDPRAVASVELVETSVRTHHERTEVGTQ